MTLALLQPLEHFFRHILNGLHQVGLPWAWAIVALTVIVRMLLVPLTVKQIHSMQNMQRHAPQMKELQKKYKGDRQKLNEELMKFLSLRRSRSSSVCTTRCAPSRSIRRPGISRGSASYRTSPGT